MVCESAPSRTTTMNVRDDLHPIALHVFPFPVDAKDDSPFCELAASTSKNKDCQSWNEHNFAERSSGSCWQGSHRQSPPTAPFPGYSFVANRNTRAEPFTNPDTIRQSGRQSGRLAEHSCRPQPADFLRRHAQAIRQHRIRIRP